MVRRIRSILIVLSALALVAVGATAAVGDDETVKLKAKLKGTNELPAADPDGNGTAKVKIDVDAGRACFDLSFDDTGTPNRSHIHRGTADSNGPVVVAFFELRSTDAPASDPRHDDLEEGELEDCVAADPAVLQAIVDDPQGYYVNLHNARFPSGSIRGQLHD